MSRLSIEEEIRLSFNLPSTIALFDDQYTQWQYRITLQLNNVPSRCPLVLLYPASSRIRPHLFFPRLPPLQPLRICGCQKEGLIERLDGMLISPDHFNTISNDRRIIQVWRKAGETETWV